MICFFVLSSNTKCAKMKDFPPTIFVRLLNMKNYKENHETFKNYSTCLFIFKTPLNCSINSLNKAICLGMVGGTETPGNAQFVIQAKIDL